MIEIKELKKSFGAKQVIDISALTVPNGSIFAILGVNGSGKSTLLRILSGVYKKDGGTVEYDGQSMEKDALRKNLLYISDDPLSKGESLDSLFLYFSTFYAMTKDRYEYYLKRFDIDLKDKQLNHYSKGMKRRVYLAIALAVSPAVLILDESFDGLDIAGKTVFKEEILKCLDADPERTVIIASHSIKEVEDLTDRYVILKRGQVVYDSSREEQISCHKVEVGFKEDFDFRKLESLGFTILHSTNKVATLLTEKSESEIIAALEEYHPALTDIGELSMEELFFLKSEVREDELR